MIDKNVGLFLNYESLEALEASEAVRVLIQYPEAIDCLKRDNEEFESFIKDKMLEIEGLQKAYDDMDKLPFFDKLFKRKANDKQRDAFLSKIKQLLEEIKKLNEYVEENEENISKLKEKIDELSKAITSVNLKPEDVVGSYYEIKVMLENGIDIQRAIDSQPEYAEIIDVDIETAPEIVEVNIETLHKKDEKVQKSAESVEYKNESVAIQKFKKRLEKTKEIQDSKKKDKSPSQPQNG